MEEIGGASGSLYLLKAAFVRTRGMVEKGSFVLYPCSILFKACQRSFTSTSGITKEKDIMCLLSKKKKKRLKFPHWLSKCLKKENKNIKSAHS